MEISLNDNQKKSANFGSGIELLMNDKRKTDKQSTNNDIELVINEQGITSKSLYINSQICWEDIQSSSITNRGVLIRHPAGISYLSNLILDQSAIDFIKHKLK